MKGIPYWEGIGSLMYAALGTQPDILLAVTILSQYMQNLSKPHWEEVKCMFQYLKGTLDQKLVIGGKGL